ncbi:MAG TPA: hypothetical protein VJ801_05975 [Polyangia bacterium]|nr:hypothetical protein [Polyangia bacterium]
MKPLLVAAVRSRVGLSGSRRAIVRLLGVAPAALLFSGLFALWAGPQAAPVAATAPTGTVVAWGDNTYHGTDVPAGLLGVTAIAAGPYDSLALKSDGTVVAWGDNTYGETTIPAGLSGVTAIAAGEYHSLALKSNGTVIAWGDDSHRQITIPAGLAGVFAISAGYLHSLALVPAAAPATYHALTPVRLLDTRNGTGGLSGPFTNHAARTFQATGGTSGVPANATAVTGNLTVTGQTSSGYFSIGPVATNNPGSSTLNFPVGDDRANAVTVALGAGGTLSITFVAPSNGPTAQAIFDVTGYFTADMTGAVYVPITPTRLLDTRNGTGGLAGPFTNHTARPFPATGGSSGVPANATALTGNLTVTGQTSSGYFFMGPVFTNDPTSSTLNFPVGDDRANAVTVALGSGYLSITFVAPSDGPTAQAIFDVTGYFVPAAS